MLRFPHRKVSVKKARKPRRQQPENTLDYSSLQLRNVLRDHTYTAVAQQEPPLQGWAFVAMSPNLATKTGQLEILATKRSNSGDNTRTQTPQGLGVLASSRIREYLVREGRPARGSHVLLLILMHGATN